MSLADRNAPGYGTRQGMPCSVATLLAELPPAEAKAFKAMLDAPWRVWPHSEVERAVRAEGHFVGVGTVGKHRRGSCRCGRAAA